MFQLDLIGAHQIFQSGVQGGFGHVEHAAFFCFDAHLLTQLTEKLGAVIGGNVVGPTVFFAEDLEIDQFDGEDLGFGKLSNRGAIDDLE